LQVSAGAAVSPAISEVASAEDYPSHPIKIIVPYVAGGPTDVMARMAGEIVRVALGQPVIIENVPGATGTIAVGRVTQSAPDGYTLSVGTLSTHVLNGALFTLKYDLLNDLQPVALLPNSPFIIVSKNAAPAMNLREFIAWIKANPGKISFGHPGLGSTPHVATVQFMQTIGVEVQTVPYRGAGPALQDLIAGQIDAMFGQPSVLVEQINAGRIRGYALTARAR
jgi:tripartite-type tricarboxylate transporter receptor subunit TctC